MIRPPQVGHDVTNQNHDLLAAAFICSAEVIACDNSDDRNKPTYRPTISVI